jgi:uncharacterized protein YqgQ
MLDLAIKYEKELKLLFCNIIFDKKYMFLSGHSYYDEYKADNSTWQNHEFVSLDKNKNVIGYIKYSVNRDSLNCGSLQIVNFSDDNKIITKDVMQCLDDVFTKFKFNKLSYCVYVGNPIERSYDRLTKKYGGHIVGTKIKDSKLMDGNYYDLKLYEVLREDYLRCRPILKKKRKIKCTNA